MDIIWTLLGIFVSFVLLILALRVAAFLVGASLIPGLIFGGLSYWLFDAFWPSYIVGGIIGVFCGLFGDSESSGRFSSDSTSTYYPNHTSQSRSSSHAYSSASSESRSSDRSRIEELRRNYQDAMYSYDQYKSRAEQFYDQADTEERYADDYRRKYEEWHEESDLRSAESCCSSASHYRYEGRSCEEKASRYYDEARRYERELNAMGVYI